MKPIALAILVLAGCSVFTDPIEPPYKRKGPVYMTTKEGGTVEVWYNYPDNFRQYCGDAYACAYLVFNEDGSTNPDYPCNIMFRADHQSDTAKAHEEQHCTDGDWHPWWR